MIVVERVTDTASGYTLDRPGIEQARRLLRQGVVDVIVERLIQGLPEVAA